MRSEAGGGPVPHVRRVYYERRALEWPDTKNVLTRLSHLPTVEIDHYKDVFNRPGQHFQTQKQSPALILAVEKGQLLYDAGARFRSWGTDIPLYYNAPVRNCLFNCDYCFLQGMHSSGNIVLFVNSPDFMRKAAEQARQERILVSISYMTDLLAFEPLAPICRKWIGFAGETDNLEIEIRTKSEFYGAIRTLSPSDSTILSVSLSPARIAARYERGCASFAGRLFAARQALEAGWRVRLCFDPMVYTENWEAQYDECVRETFTRLDPSRIEEVSFGVVRMAPDFLSRIRSGRSDSDILYYPFRIEDQGASRVATYSTEVRDRMRTHMLETLRRHMPEDRIHFAHG